MAISGEVKFCRLQFGLKLSRLKLDNISIAVESINIVNSQCIC